MNAIRLYGHYVRASLRAQMQYPASFVLTSLGAFLATGVEFIALWALFARFHRVAGWRFGEVALFYAVIGVSFALADGLTRGFDVFGVQFVKTGDFDRVLVRPRAAARLGLEPVGGPCASRRHAVSSFSGSRSASGGSASATTRRREADPRRPAVRPIEPS